MSARILFIILPYKNKAEEIPKHRTQTYVAFPYGVLSMATYVKYNANSDVEILDCNVIRDYKKEIYNRARDWQPNIIALSMMFDASYKYLREILDEITIPCHCVIGGMAATGQYHEILINNPEIDAVCYYEGEIPLNDLATHPVSALNDCPAWITRTKIMEGVEPRKVVIQNLDEVINLDYSLVDIKDYPMQESFSPNAKQVDNKRQFYLVSSRGCPFSCAFCMHSADPDKTMRYATIDAVIDHVRYLVKEFRCNVLTFYDDQLLLNKARAKELFRQLAQFNLRIEIPNGVSVAFIDDELARLMQNAGVDTVWLAIESGSPYVLNELIRKPLKTSQVKPAIDILHSHGIFTVGFFVIGMPGETDEHRKETLDFIKKSGLDWASFQNATPIKGSDLYNQCIEKEYIPKDYRVTDMNISVINTPDLSAEDRMKKTYEMNLDVNFVNNRAMLQGDYSTAMKEFLRVLDRDPNHAFALNGIAICAQRLRDRIMMDDLEWRWRGQMFGW